jgi:hypothetical protein
MVHETQNYWASGLCPSPGILYNITFRKLDLFPSSGEGRETPTLLGHLQRANLYHWARVGVSLPSSEDGNRSSFRNVVFSSI